MATLASRDVFAQSSSDPQGRMWHVVRTLPRQEKALARMLEHCGIAFFLPSTEQRSHYMGRLAVTQWPTYPGYLFLFGNESDCRRCLATGLTAGILETVDAAGLVRVLRRIARAIKNDFTKLPPEADFLKMTSQNATPTAALALNSSELTNP